MATAMPALVLQSQRYPQLNLQVYNSNGALLASLAIPTAQQDRHISPEMLYRYCSFTFVFHNPSEREFYKLGANNTQGTTALQLNSGISVAPGNYMGLDLRHQLIELTTNYAPRRVRTQDTGTQDTGTQDPDSQSQGRSEWSRLQTKFRNSLRQRDGCCAITGQNRASSFKDPFRDLDATHIFPYITDPLPETEIGKSRIYSAQNGLLLSADIHSLFDSIELGIDPDANYKIIVFGPVPTGIGGTRLRDSARSGTWRMSADLLRWHLRMCLYNNLKANSEPQTVWEEDLGEDPRGEILSQPDAAERMVSFSRAWEN
ncbi:unnamed protein product [Penicillium roqueforti FM164]|uniref:Genomic scaffold, ProqFM164S03 n=1 Tax=Penicillium roqueforti (strain FM164) TaxID=1365484 RepID=W6QDA6_PENRF|nr:unnamed protein product [Penicillium roqueforti FM164]